MKKNISQIIIIALFVSLFSFQNALASNSSLVISSLPISVISLSDKISAPDNYTAISPLYEISLAANNLASGKTYFAYIDYSTINNSVKQVFYFDKTKAAWQPLPTTDYLVNHTVMVESPFTYVRLAVFAKNNTPVQITPPVINIASPVVTPVTTITNTVSDKTSVESKLPITAVKLADNISAPWSHTALTPLYQISLPADKLAAGKTYSVDINYVTPNNNYKQVFYFDKTKDAWRPLPTTDHPKQNKVSVEIPFTYVRLAVFSDNNTLAVGRASWYAYKGGLFAASPDFAKGSVLRVTNLDNGKSVDVTINDFGPERNIHPDRVVDLDKVAFAKIAATSAGTINVKIDVLKSVGQDLNKTLSSATEPSLSAWSAVIVRESDGQILWGKNSDKVSPLASLTKIVAAQVFLDTKPNLAKVVTYKQQDEDYNYLYCKPGESAKLTVKDGETMTLENLLYSALVGSANNAVESLVRNSGLTRDEFIAAMNNKVKKIGATSTHFVEPTGLSENNMSSPADYAIITKDAFTNSLLQKISVTSKYSFSTINTKVVHNLTNTNKLIATNKYSIVGSKTGYLNEARYCLMTRVKTALGNLIVINFGSSSSVNNFSDSEKLINYGIQLLNS